MAETRIISIVGRKNAGKTTLIVALASEFVRKGRRVMTIKRASQPVEVDREGSDGYRHFHEGKAERVLIAAPDRLALFERSPEAKDPLALARRYLDGADIVLVEGFSRAPLPKIEIFRREVIPPTTLYDAHGDSTDDWIAIVTDDDKYEAHCPVLHFRDTMWMQLLANIAWDRAKVL